MILYNLIKIVKSDRSIQ